MGKTEVIVDTCFLQKVSSEGKNVENIKRILTELDFAPVTHPYIAEQELILHSYLDNLINEGYIKIIPYENFIKDDWDRQLYEGYFKALHEDLRRYLKAKGSLKPMAALQISKGQTIYNIHMQGNSIADVHLVLMAAFLRLPVVMTEDSDIELLRTMSKKKLSLGAYSLQIYNAMDLMRQIARKENSTISKKELEKMLDEMGERKNRSEIKAIWNENHSG